MEVPETRYARRPDGVNIAFQVFGDGPRDLVYVPGFVSHLDLAWTDTRLVAFYRRLASFARVITFDKPGTGVSDPIAHVPTLEERMADVRTVLEAAGSTRAVLLGFSEGGPTCLLLAATWPELVESVVVYGSLVKAHPTPEELAAHGEPPGLADERWALMHDVTAHWGSGRSAELLAPGAAGTLERRLWALFERASASPRMAQALVEAAERIDVTGVLGQVHAPTLVLHRVGDFVPVMSGRLIAACVPGARMVELPGDDHAFWLGELDPVMDEVEQFVTGARHHAAPERTLASVVFTDVVASTEHAAQLGDTRWRELLEQYDAALRRQVADHGGRVVKAMGDGHLSVFAAPGRAVHCADALRDVAGRLGLAVRSGVHTGECEALGDDVGGLAVHIGARVAALAGPGEVLVSGTVKDLLVGSTHAFADRGERELRGVPGTWRVFALGSAAPAAPLPTERAVTVLDRALLGAARRNPRGLRRAAALARRLSVGGEVASRSAV